MAWLNQYVLQDSEVKAQRIPNALFLMGKPEKGVGQIRLPFSIEGKSAALSLKGLCSRCADPPLD